VLSCGLLFKEFHFHPDPFPDSDEAIIALELERLAFWSSAKISTHVRACYVELGHNEIVLDSRSPLVSACFETVSRFTNLHYLECGVPWMNLVEMPALELILFRI
jgi:hypothetical protein